MRVSACLLLACLAQSTWPASLQSSLQWYPVPAGGGESAAAALPRPSSVAPTALPAQQAADLPYSELVAQAARQHELDPLLVHAVIQTESAYRPSVVSSKGAQGLMQVMPATGARFGQTALSEPRANLLAGTAYLAWLLRQFEGRLDLALAGYNAGEGAVKRYGGTIPPFAETRAYVDKVLQRYRTLRAGNEPVELTTLLAVSRRKKNVRQNPDGVWRDVRQLWRLLAGGKASPGS